MTSVDPRRTQPFCTPRCYRQCRCSRWPGYLNRFGWPVIPSAQPYYEKVLSYSPIAYWPLWETAGATAEDLVNSPAQDGTYVGVTLNNAIGPDGVNGCPFFDGANDYVNVMTAALAAIYDNDEGTMIVWARVANVGVWTDAAFREFMRCTQLGGAYQRMQKDNGNNTIDWIRWDTIGAQSRVTGGHADTDWMCLGMTWTQSGNVFQAWKDGATEGAPIAGLNVAPGALNAAWIGAQDGTPQRVWNGWLAHVQLYDQALGAAAMLDIATV